MALNFWYRKHWKKWKWKIICFVFICKTVYWSFFPSFKSLKLFSKVVWYVDRSILLHNTESRNFLSKHSMVFQNCYHVRGKFVTNHYPIRYLLMCLLINNSPIFTNVNKVRFHMFSFLWYMLQLLRTNGLK